MPTNGLKQASTKQQVVSLLRDLASQIQAMDDSEIEGVLSGKWRLEIRPPRRTSKDRRTQSRCSDEELERLRDALHNVDTREQARGLIDKFLHTKAELTRFARVLDLPAPKNISSEQLKIQLVEGTVGYRIRSAAIRGNTAAY